MKDRARKYVTYVFSNLSDTGCNSFVLDYESKHQDPDNNVVRFNYRLPMDRTVHIGILS